jgi:hypothetical protein
MVYNLQDKMNSVLRFNGTQTYFMQYDAGVYASQDWELTLANANPFNVYLTAGLAADPSESINDIEIKGQTYVKISSRSFPSLKTSFVIQAHVQGISFPDNMPVSNTLMVTFNRLASTTEQENEALFL